MRCSLKFQWYLVEIILAFFQMVCNYMEHFYYMVYMIQNHLVYLLIFKIYEIE